MKRMTKPSLGAALIAICVLATACGEGQQYGDSSRELGNEPIGLAKLYSAELVAEGLMNPSSVAFHDSQLTICDTGHGKIVAVDLEDGSVSDLVTGFETQYWKPGEGDAPDRFKLGPLSHVWLNDGGLAVSDSGFPDSEDRIAFFSKVEGGTTVDSAKTSNGIPPTSDDELDKGEGNYSGLALSNDGQTIWVAGQGADAKTWILSCDVSSRELKTRFSADDNGISVNSPMDIHVRDDGTLLVLYSGTGGEEDGLIVHWDPKTGKPAAQWPLPGLIDPMGFDQIPGTDEFAVVDNNWALKEVKDGRLARVTLPKGGGAAEVDILATRLKGPVACRFGPGGRLYVAQLGEQFDTDKGQVLAISGF